VDELDFPKEGKQYQIDLLWQHNVMVPYPPKVMDKPHQLKNVVGDKLD
jgi:hypothetical protein